MDLLIIVPTYNEVQTVGTLVEAVFRSLPRTHILFVDDSSPDGTGIKVDTLARRDDRIHVLHRPTGRGYACALLDGFRWALKREYRIIGQMDADLSHDPPVLPSLLSGIGSFDFAVGSRYVAGGGIRRWDIYRRLLSRGGNLYARLVLRDPVRDLTSGFVMWRREVLEAIGLSKLRSRGYVFQIELKHRACKAGFTHVEVPIVFEERAGGRSKINPGIILEAFWRVPALRFNLPREWLSSP